MAETGRGDDECDERALVPYHAQLLSLSALHSLKSPPPPNSTNCPSHIIDTPLCPRSPLLHVASDVRSLVWQYMDNRSAIRYLSACKRLRGLYHTFPLTQPVSKKQFQSISSLVRLPDLPIWVYVISFALFWFCINAVMLPISFFAIALASKPAAIAVGVTFVVLPFFLPLWLWCWGFRRPPPTHCCGEDSSLDRNGWLPMPRIGTLAGWCDTYDMACLQHVVKALVGDANGRPISQCKLPATLRELLLSLHNWRELRADTLPRQLTLLAMVGLNDVVLQHGMLPQSLMTLGLYYQRTVHDSTTNPHTTIQPIAAGVLPSQLQTLQIIWSRSLADLVLPASLTHLDVRSLPNLSIPPSTLPVGLQSLTITTATGVSFDPHNLHGALPSGLRVLRLFCIFSQPLMVDLFTQVPQLEELCMAYPCPLTAGLLAPLTQLRVLCLEAYRHPIAAGQLPPSLRRLAIVVGRSERAEELVPLAVRHASLVVEFQSVADPIPLLTDQFVRTT